MQITSRLTGVYADDSFHTDQRPACLGLMAKPLLFFRGENEQDITTYAPLLKNLTLTS